MAAGPGDRSDLWLLLPEPVRRLPADLAAVVALVVLTVLAVLLPVVSETPLRVVLGLPFVLFVPGYAFIAALFPEAGESPTADGSAGDEAPDTGSAGDESPDAGDRSGIDGIERVALSFGLSIAIVPLIGLVLNFTPWGIRLVPILASVSGFTLIAVAAAAVRRRELPEEERFRVPYRAWVAAGRAELLEPDSRGDAALNVLLVLSIVLATASVGYAVAVPKQGEQFSELYLLTEGEDGDLVADDYPTEFVRGEPRSLVVGIGNQEHRTVEYTVVTELQAVEIERSGNGSVGTNASVNASASAGNVSMTVLEEEEIRRFETELAHNRTWIRPHNVTPTLTGEDLRLTYLLYESAPPEDPTVDSAYRAVWLWVNVSESPG
jgi:uncharacterized membrane protein